MKIIDNPITENRYKELLELAMSDASTPIDRMNLFYWFKKFSPEDWTGEYFKIDFYRRLYPVYYIGFDDSGNPFRNVLVDAKIELC